ncbi:DUF4430 domain-containing protein [Aeoliella sp. SH292]|uniref:DUF4430 domain-containing protein n=1 Tax=Aeoliella sp. SH292 TaxID=3454464 RepID=UPI003F952A58
MPATEERPKNPRGLYLVPALIVVLGVVLAVNYWGAPTRTEVSTTGGGSSPVDPLLGVTFEAVDLPPVTVAHVRNMTVLDAMRAVEQANHAWKFAYQGTGVSTFLVSIADQENEGASGRNWQYEINGEHAQRGIGTQTLKRGDQVLWKFATYE